MSGFTRLGTAIWDWEPFIDLDSNARVLWLALYTSATAKRNVPGLWHGSVASMADAARMQADDTIQSLDKLIERELAEFDTKLRVLRLTSLPDCGESPTNGKTIHGWWSKFTMTPACAIRDSHVPTLQWIMEEWMRVNNKPLSNDHKNAWTETFGTVSVPAVRKRGVRRLADSDTSSSVQCGLFENRSDTLSLSLSDSSSPQPVFNPVEKPNPNDFAVPDRNSKGTGSGIGSGSGSGDLSSLRADPPPVGDPGEGSEPPRPRLTLVPPPPVPFTVDELLGALAEGFGGRATAALAEASRAGLQRAIGGLALVSAGLGDLAILRDWVKAGELRKIVQAMDGEFFSDICVRHGRGTGMETPLALLARDGFIAWATEGGNLVVALQRARTWKTEQDERAKRGNELAEELKAAREKAGV